MEILTRTIEIIKEAKSKGFEMDHAISPVMFESWMNAELTFCNTACAILAMWLREKDLFVTVAGPAFGGFGYFVGQPMKQRDQPRSFGSHKTWEDAWLAGIKAALKLI